MKAQEWIDRFVVALGKGYYASLPYKRSVACGRLMHLAKDDYSPEESAAAYLQEVRGQVSRCATELTGGPPALCHDHSFRDKWTTVYISSSGDPIVALEALIACGALMSPEEAVARWKPDSAYCRNDVPVGSSPALPRGAKHPCQTRVDWVNQVVHLVADATDVSDAAFVNSLADRTYDDLADVQPTTVAEFLNLRLKSVPR